VIRARRRRDVSRTVSASRISRGASIAIAYAVKYPERVSIRLAWRLCARPRPAFGEQWARESADLMLKLMAMVG
jgi:hypothetical protein